MIITASRGIDMGRKGPWGNPVILGKRCPICSAIHTSTGSTLRCYELYLSMRLKLQNDFLDPVAEEQVFCPGCHGAEGCHLTIIQKYLEGQTLDLTVPKKLACIGSRATPPDVLDEMFKLGQDLASAGYFGTSGGAVGADQVWSEAWRQRPENFLVHRSMGQARVQVQPGQRKVTSGQVPQFQVIASRLHPNWSACSQYVRALHARNVGILCGSSAVLCYSNPTAPGGGGTGQGLRQAEVMGLPIFDRAVDPDAFVKAREFLLAGSRPKVKRICLA